MTLDEQENRDFQEWLEASEAHRDEYAGILSYMHAKVRVPVNPVRIDDACDRIFRKGRNRRRLFSIMSSAAALVIGVLVGLNVSGMKSRSGLVQYAAGTAPSEFTLPDNSKVCLNAHSSLTYDSRFGRKDRRVSLVGEGYFKVEPDYEKEFIVNLGPARIHVIGTEFNAKNVPDEPVIVASLVSGSILFTAQNQKLKIRPETSVIYSKADEKMSLEHFSADTLTAWTQNLFRYKGRSLADVLRKTAAGKGVRIEIRKPEYMNARISCTFERSLSFEQILHILAVRKEFTWSIKDGAYILEGRPDHD